MFGVMVDSVAHLCDRSSAYATKMKHTGVSEHVTPQTQDAMHIKVKRHSVRSSAIQLFRFQLEESQQATQSGKHQAKLTPSIITRALSITVYLCFLCLAK